MTAAAQNGLDPSFLAYLKRLEALPFVGKPTDDGRCFWEVNPPSDFEPACHMGARYASRYLNLLDLSRDRSNPLLTLIVRDVISTHEDEGPGHVGLEIGFFGAIESRIRRSGIFPLERGTGK